MSRSDILDEGSVSVTPNTDAFGAWVSTLGLQQVALSMSVFPTFNGTVVIQESRDSSTVLCEHSVSSGTLTNRVLTPGAAFVRLRMQFPSSGTVAYSLRGV